jgi:uncharacterized protein (DUF1015 family)
MVARRGLPVVAIAPFRALRYAPGTDLAAVTSPPHDVLHPGQRESLTQRDRHNIVRLILGDGDGEDRFTRAARLLAQWQTEGVLVRDRQPAFYQYEVRHGPPEARRVMRAFFCRLALDPTYTAVRRHEKILPGKAGDRRRLLDATECNTEPIWLLYRDERGWVDEILSSNAFDELVRFTDEEGDEHRLWRVDRPEAVGEIIAQFEDRELVIADGHHRYQTALDHFGATGDPLHGSILVGLARDTDPGIRIEPTHRLIKQLGMPIAGALERARSEWTVEPGPDADMAATLAEHLESPDACAVVAKQDGRLRSWILTRAVPVSDAPLAGLAVTQVHGLLLRWGIDSDSVERRLRYTQRHDEAVQAVADGQVEVAVLLPPEPVRAVLDAAREGHLMPQKATYFVPKLRSGLVLGPLDEPPPRPWQELAGDPGKMDFRLPKF